LCIEAGMLGGCLAHLLVLSPGLVCLLVKGSQLWFDCLWWLFGSIYSIPWYTGTIWYQ
jgi:hypothetical protein